MAGATNHLYYGDNLAVMPGLSSESVDLIYLDPPFNSSRNYNVIFSRDPGRKLDASAQIRAFTDTWRWTQEVAAEYERCVEGGLPNGPAEALVAFRKLLGENDALAYLVNMAPRLAEMHRLLRQTGSIYLHCDPVMSHYLKILLDTIFGVQKFQNEVIWHHGLGAMNSNARYPSKHDVLLFYSKSGAFTFTKQRGEVTPQMARKYSHEDDAGKYMMSYGKKYYLKGGKPFDDVWDIAALSPTSKERLGYPTQKPLALLERIILASSNEGDVVLDPFCGCGTAVDAAQSLKRKWIGIDITFIAVDLIDKRLRDRYGATVKQDFDVSGVPKDGPSASALFERNPLDFERWAVSLVGAQPNERQVADKGIDGIARFPLTAGNYGRVLVSVKGGKSLAPAMVRDLRGTLERERAELGMLVTRLPITAGMASEIQHSGLFTHPATGQRYPRLQAVTIGDLLSGTRPVLPPTVLPYVSAQRAADGVQESFF